MLCRPNNRHGVLSDDIVLSLFLRKHVFEQKPKVVAVYKPVYTSSELSCGERSAEGTDSPRDRRHTSRTYDQNTSRSIGRKTELKSITALQLDKLQSLATTWRTAHGMTTNRQLILCAYSMQYG